MHAFICRSLRPTTIRRTFKSCRHIAGHRFPNPPRAFHASAKAQTSQNGIPDIPPDASNSIGVPSDHLPAEELRRLQDEVTTDGQSSSKGLGATDPVSKEGVSTADPTTKVKDRSTYGSATRRATRGVRKAKDWQTPILKVPEWFLERNVCLSEQLKQEKTPLKLISNQELASLSKKPEKKHLLNVEDQPTPESLNSEIQGEEESRYQIDECVMLEILALAQAGLRPALPDSTHSASASKPHLVLQSPKGGGDLFLESVVKNTAQELESDLIKVDIQDIVEIAKGLGSEVSEQELTSLRSTSYDIYMLPEEFDKSGAEDQDGYEGAYNDGEEESASSSRSLGPSSSRPAHGVSRPRSHRRLTEMVKSLKVFIPISSMAAIQPNDTRPSLPPPSIEEANQASQVPENTEINRKTMLFDLFLDSVPLKRPAVKQVPRELQEDVDESTSAPAETQPQNAGGISNSLIIMVQDYLELYATPTGGKVIGRLHGAVRRRRNNGQRILIIGTSSSEDLIPSMSQDGITSLQTESGQPFCRTVITPCTSPDLHKTFKEDAEQRANQINVRHLQDVLQQLSPTASPIEDIVSQPGKSLDMTDVSSLSDSVWQYDTVYRVASMTLGVLEDEHNELSADHLRSAISLLNLSDQSKFDWLDQQKEQAGLTQPITETSPDELRRAQGERLKKLRKNCNAHEKKLLNGVIDASSITTTFEDIQTSPATVEALKTLTSLSLIRPESFTYGVLATDKIPGLLLYGPPGTGKTLLAKAVAKESGATVLDVSGSDVYDMYVGEGEKNVRAIFTLARKLSPCVVFIDEADALFGSRNASGNRTSHRELINQFLREWDGLGDGGPGGANAFILVATNRPFDLDDAVMRRLPRRLLVDLPTERDREAILRIHLRGETLDPAVSIPVLAARTPFYSGSDLKNLAVAAALACVREENDAAARHAAEQRPYAYPAKRTLAQVHFDKALAEIGASISEDMSSLAAIRKFDEKYGDRSGRRKRIGGWGFGNLTEKEREKLEEGRVRSLDAAL